MSKMKNFKSGSEEDIVNASSMVSVKEPMDPLIHETDKLKRTDFNIHIDHDKLFICDDSQSCNHSTTHTNDDEDRLDEDNKNFNPLNKAIVYIQKASHDVCHLIQRKTGGYFLKSCLVLLYLSYFIWAMTYELGSEDSMRLLFVTIFFAFVATRTYVANLLLKIKCVNWCFSQKTQVAVERMKTANFFLRWIVYGLVGGFVAYTIINIAIEDTKKLQSLLGLLLYILMALLLSSAPSQIKWHTIYMSVGLQFILAVLVMRWHGGKNAVLWIQHRLNEFFSNTKQSSILLFGETYTDHYMIFGAMPIVFLTNAMLSMLYYLGAMQFLVKAIGFSLRFILKTTAIESTGVACSIFLEGASAMLALRPYLSQLTNAEFFTISTACLASIGGAFLAILAQLGIPMQFMIPAMVISAPATFTVCKLMEPETRKPKKFDFDGDLPEEMRHASLLEAAQMGAISVLSLVANVVVSVFAFLSLISWLNSTFVWFGERVGIINLTMDKILSYLFYPFAYIMGVHPEDCQNVAILMGLRFSSSNFIAFLKMATFVANRHQLETYIASVPNATMTYSGGDIILDHVNITLTEGIISNRSEAISTYALCGFSGILSIFITLGILNTLVPERRSWLTSQAIRLLIAGNFANFMVGCYAGLLI